MPSPAEAYLAAATAMLQRACTKNAPVLKKLGAEILYSRHYADHHRFSLAEIFLGLRNIRRQVYCFF